MHWKALIILGVVNVIYILIGGAIFHALESSNEDTTKTTINQDYAVFLSNVSSCVSADELRTFMTKVLTAYDNGVFSTDAESSASLWDYGNSVFFSMTAVTTIGYGNQTPVTSGGRAFVSIFAILGIPLTALVISGVGEKIQKLIKPITDRVWVKGRKKIDSVLKTVSIILVGMVCFFLIPAGIFSHIEGWTYGEGIYFTIITLTTVGFGDFVIGTSESGYRIPYRLLSGIWLVLGLSWVALLVGLIQSQYGTIVSKNDKKKETGNDEKEGNKTELESVSQEDAEKGAHPKNNTTGSKS